MARDLQKPIDSEVEHRIESGEVQAVNLPSWSSSAGNTTAADWKAWLQDDAYIPEDILEDVALVCVTDTIRTASSSSSSSSSSLTPRSASSALAIREACYRLRIPVNVADHPELSDYSFPATHRFPLLSETKTKTPTTETEGAQNTASPLQIAITTNAKSCRFSSRIRREIIAKLPKGIGSAVDKLGKLREEVRKLDAQEVPGGEGSTTLLEVGEKEEGFSANLLNKPVPQIFLKEPKLSKCTSPHRQAAKGALPSLPVAALPTSLPLTPPATPPPTSAVVNRMEEILAGQDLAGTDPSVSSLTRMRFISQICKSCQEGSQVYLRQLGARSDNRH